MNLQKNNGVLTYETSADSWIFNNNGFGLGNVAKSWSYEAWLKNYSDLGYVGSDLNDLATERYVTTELHESIHAGQQRCFGPLAMIDLGIEAIGAQNLGIEKVYNKKFTFVFEYDAESNETDGKGTDNFYIFLNRWRWF
jgi:hypothetical protein